MVLAQPSAEEEVSMNTVTTIGIDLAKSVFSICGVNAAGRVMSRPVILAWRDALPVMQALPDSRSLCRHADRAGS